MTEERGARETLAQLAETQAKKIRVLEVSKQQLVRNLLAMRIELENVKSGNKKSSADELERLQDTTEKQLKVLDERLEAEMEKNEVALTEINTLNAELLRKEQELQYCKRTLDEVEHERNTSLVSTAKAQKAAEVHSALARERMWSAEVNAASAQHLLGVVEERAAFSERKQAFEQNGGLNTDARSAAPVERRTSPLDMKRLFSHATDDGSTPVPLFTDSGEGAFPGTTSRRPDGDMEDGSPVLTSEPDGDLMLSEARKLMVTKGLNGALHAHAAYHKFKATRSDVEGEAKALEGPGPVGLAQKVHTKYAEFAAMKALVQAKNDRSLETRAEFAALENRVEELLQESKEQKSRQANESTSLASQRKIESLRLNETAEMCQSITAKFTVFQGSCLMKVQTLHNKVIDFDLLVEKLRRSLQHSERRSKSAQGQVSNISEQLKEKVSEVQMLQSERESLTTRCKEHEAFIEKVLDDLKMSKVEIDELRRMAQDSKNSNSVLRSEAENLQQQYNEAAENFKGRDVKLKEQLKSAEEQISDLQLQLETRDTENAGFRNSLTAQEEEASKLLAQLKSSEESLAATEEHSKTKVEALKTDLSEKDRKMEEQDASLHEKEELLAAQAETLNKMEQDALDFAEKCSSLADANSALEQQLLETQKSHQRESEISLAEATAAAEAAASTAAALEGELALRDSRIAERDDQLAVQESLLAEASKALDEERASVQQLEDTSKAQEALLQEASKALDEERVSVQQLEDTSKAQEALLQEASAALETERTSVSGLEERLNSQESLLREAGEAFEAEKSKAAAAEDILREVREALEQEQSASIQLREQLHSQEALLQQASQALDSDRDTAEHAQNELNSTIQEQMAQIEKQATELSQGREKVAQLEEQATSQEILLQKASEALESEQRASRAWQEQFNSHEKALSDAAHALDMERKKEAGLSEQVSELSKKIAKEQAEREALSKELASQEDLLEAASAALETERKEVEDMATDKAEMAAVLKSVQADLAETSEKIQIVEADCLEKKEEIEILNLRLEEADVACQSAAETVAQATEQRKMAQSQVADLNSQIVGFESKIAAEKKKSDRIVQQLSGQLVASGKTKEATIAQDLARMAKTLENTTDPNKREQIQERIQQLQLLMGGNPSGGDRGLIAVENALEGERKRRQQVEKDLEQALDRQFASQQETERMLEEFEVIMEENKILAEELRALKDT